MDILTYFSALPIAGFLLSAGLGIFTLTRNARHPANISFTCGMASLALIQAGAAAMMLSEGLAEAGFRLYLTGQLLLPPAWGVFSYVFARTGLRRMAREKAPVLLPIFISSAFFIFQAWGMDLEADFNGTLHTGPQARYMYLYLIIGIVPALIQLENTFRSSSGTKRWQIKYLIFGLGGILAFFIYLSSQEFLLSSYGIETVLLASAVVLICSAMVTVFMVRHRLMDVNIFVSRYFVYNSVALIAVGVYLITIGLVVHGIKVLDLPFNYFVSNLFIFVSVLALIILLSTYFLRRKVQLFINRNFYSHKYEFRDKWMETIDKVSSRQSVEELEAVLTDMISTSMFSRPVLIWLFDPLSGHFRASLASSQDESISGAHPLVGFIRQMQSPFSAFDLPKTVEGLEARSVFERTGTILCAPIKAGSDLIGFVLQGADISGERYIQDDFELLKAITTQAAVQIKNIRLSQDLINAREVEAFHRLSAFVMHDLKNLANSLSLVSQNASHNMDSAEFRKDAFRTIELTVARMKELIEKLSNLPKGQQIDKFSVPVRDYIEGVIRKLPLSADRDIMLSNEVREGLRAEIDPDALETVFVNLILNACEAIGRGGRITVSSSEAEDHIMISVSDTGPGIPADFIKNGLFRPFRSTKKTGLGIGLYQCKSVVEAHGGTIEVRSSAGSGTTFRIKLPSRAAEDAALN